MCEHDYVEEHLRYTDCGDPEKEAQLASDLGDKAGHCDCPTFLVVFKL